jgi:hypothetical protein
MASIISTPLIFPKVEPSDWNRWWKIWFKNFTKGSYES